MLQSLINIRKGCNLDATVDLINALSPLTDEQLNYLVKIIESSNNPKVRKAIVYKLTEEYENVHYDIDPIVKKIIQLKRSRYRSRLVYVCSLFDCTSYIKEFVSLYLSLRDTCLLETYSVFDEMRGPVAKSVKDGVLKKLYNYKPKESDDPAKLKSIPEISEMIKNLPEMNVVV